MALEHLNSWNSNWQNLRVVVLGLGVSGFSVADTLVELGCKVFVAAETAAEELVDLLDVIGAEHLIGSSPQATENALNEFNSDLVITSPGIRPDSELIRWAEQLGLPIWVDIELAWRLRDKAHVLTEAPIAEWICITGTNGKTTTTQLVEAMLIEAGIRATSCGNIGTPILDPIRDPQGFEVLVVELSSFQLHYLGHIEPWASVVLNLADDHLDWHGSFAKYVQAKGKVFSNVKVACVYNVEDSQTEKLVELADVAEGARAIGFTRFTPGLSQVGFVEDILCDRAFLENRKNEALELARLEDIEKIGVVTPHLLANLAAASALVRSLDIQPDAIAGAIRKFKLDGHRIELVATQDGIDWIDDSKATNPHAAAASLTAFNDVIWIVGGLLKGVDLSELIKNSAKRVRAAVVIGKERAEVIEAFAKQAPEVQIFEIDDSKNVMATAVSKAKELAMPGDTVLLAPAAASMDQFKDYADRGNKFQTAVKQVLGFTDGEVSA